MHHFYKNQIVLPLLIVTVLVAGKARADQTRLAFGSCAKVDLPQPIWRAVADWKPDAFVTLGDIIYADTEDMDLMRAMYADMDAIAEFRKLRESCPFYGTWDDHDYGMRDGDASFPQRESAQQVFLDFLREPSGSARRTTPGVYDAVYLDEPARVQLILLDTRFFRSAWTEDTVTRRRYRPVYDADRTILGEAQWAWLEEQLKQPAEVRIIASSIQVVNDEHGFESWGLFPLERDRLFKLIRKTRAAGVIIISGDRHFAELSAMDGGVGYPMYDFTSSGLTHAGASAYKTPNSRRIGRGFNELNFGTVVIDWDEPDPEITLRIHDVKGNTQFEHRLSLSRLQFR